MFENVSLAEQLAASDDGLSSIEMDNNSNESNNFHNNRSGAGYSSQYSFWLLSGVGVRVQVMARIFSAPYRPPNLLHNAYQGLFPLG
jgi:hypothetical protein